MLVDGAAEVLNAQQHFIRAARHGQHRADLLAQRRHAGRADVALEIQHEYPATGFSLTGLFGGCGDFLVVLLFEF